MGFFLTKMTGRLSIMPLIGQLALEERFAGVYQPNRNADSMSAVS
jgi:hypothetical protein